MTGKLVLLNYIAKLAIVKLLRCTDVMMDDSGKLKKP